MQRAHLLRLLTLLAGMLLPAALGSPIVTAAPATAAATVNDQTQARLRVSQCVLGAPAMDIYIDGQIPVDTDIPLANLNALDATRYEYLTPGTHQVAVVPGGQSLAQAFLSPLDVPVVAGHRYTVVVLGQKEDSSHQALVIDETAAYQAIGAKPTDATHITVNNIKGVPGIDFAVSGVVRDKNAPYGGFVAAIWPGGTIKGLAITVSGSPDKVIDSSTDEWYNAPPGTDTLDCFGGHYPGQIGQEYDVHTSPNTSSLNAPAFLQLLTDEARNDANGISFNAFLGALQTTGLAQMLATAGPHMVFAPTDQAFAALPKNQLNALLANPRALADLVRAHIVAGYYPPGTLAHPGFTRTVTNLQGTTLMLPPGSQVFANGAAVGLDGYAMVANGTRLFWISKLLVAPGSAAPTAVSTPVASPRMPTTGAGIGLSNLLSLLGAVLAVLLAGGLLRRRGAARR